MSLPNFRKMFIMFFVTFLLASSLLVNTKLKVSAAALNASLSSVQAGTVIWFGGLEWIYLGGNSMLLRNNAAWMPLTGLWNQTTNPWTHPVHQFLETTFANSLTNLDWVQPRWSHIWNPTYTRFEIPSEGYYSSGIKPNLGTVGFAPNGDWWLSTQLPGYGYNATMFVLNNGNGSTSYADANAVSKGIRPLITLRSGLYLDGNNVVTTSEGNLVEYSLDAKNAAIAALAAAQEAKLAALQAAASAAAADARTSSISSDTSYIKNTQLVNIDGALRDGSGNTTISVANSIKQTLNSGGQVYGFLSSINTTAGIVSNSVNTVSGQVSNVQNSANTISSQVGNVQSTANTVSGQVGTVSGQVSNVQSTANTVSGQVTGVQSSVNNVQTTANTVSSQVSGVQGSVNTTNTKVDTVQNSVNSLSQLATDIKKTITDSNLIKSLSALNKMTSRVDNAIKIGVDAPTGTILTAEAPGIGAHLITVSGDNVVTLNITGLSTSAIPEYIEVKAISGGVPVTSKKIYKNEYFFELLDLE